MALVILPVVFPAVLAGQSNGKLPDRILVSTPGLQGGPTVRLVTTAARCWRAMSAAALDAEVVLGATSYGDSYRDYQRQVNLFTSRYQVEPTANGYKLWDSDGNGTRERWYKKDGVATAAVPGTSNHGWGLAIDIANASGARLRWLEQNAPRYGFSWETLPEEPWHLRNVTGDNIPAAVLAYEQEQSMASDLDQFVPPYGGVRENTYMAHHLLLALHSGEDPYHGYWNGVDTPKPSALWDLLRAMDAKLDQVLTLLSEGVQVPAEVAVSTASVAEIATATVDQFKGRL